MNYLAHGWRFLDRPWFLAGTAIPDWLSVADRRVRMRGPRVRPFADGSGSAEAELAAGVLQHLDDDQWFHRTPAFFETTAHLTRLFRELLGPDDGFRPGFLGHIVTELLLDSVLIERMPELLDRYYEALDRLDPVRIEHAVNRMGTRTTATLAPLIPHFRQEQFLRDYLDPRRLLWRLNQVMGRIKLKPLPDQTAAVLTDGRAIVAHRAADLLRPPA